MNSPLGEPDPIQVPLSLDGSELLVFDPAPSGWARYWGPDDVHAIMQVRFGTEDMSGRGSIVVRELHVSGRDESDVFSSGLLRTLPFSRMVAAVNRASAREKLLPLPGPAQLQVTMPKRSRWLLPPDERATLKPPQLRLEVPSDRRRPDSFYALVADTYLAQATLSNRTAQDLADANSVPKSTVHRWLKEARLRGLLRVPGQTEPVIREA